MKGVGCFLFYLFLDFLFGHGSDFRSAHGISVDGAEALHIHLGLAVGREQAVDFLHDVGQLRVAVAHTIGNVADGVCGFLETGEEGFFIRFLAVIAPSGNAGNIALDADVLEGDAAVLGIPDQVRLDARWR